MGSVFWSGAFVALAHRHGGAGFVEPAPQSKDAADRQATARRPGRARLRAEAARLDLPGLGRVHLQAQQRARDDPEADALQLGAASATTRSSPTGSITRARRAPAKSTSRCWPSTARRAATLRAGLSYLEAGDCRAQTLRERQGLRVLQKGLTCCSATRRPGGASTRCTTTATCSSSRAASTTRSLRSARCSRSPTGSISAARAAPRTTASGASTATSARSTTPRKHLRTALDAVPARRGRARRGVDHRRHRQAALAEGRIRAGPGHAARRALAPPKARRSPQHRPLAQQLGLVLQDSGEFKQALEAFEQSLTIRREIGDLIGVVTTLNNLGTIAQDQQDFERALLLFERGPRGGQADRRPQPHRPGAHQHRRDALPQRATPPRPSRC
jgi:hypothetical protein